MATPASSQNPMYISARSAEVILSDFRPLKLQTDALIFLNLLLDDILANIITTSRSILTDRLKTGLLKSMPTTIGKDALLEAEMELRAYWQRPNAIKPSASQTSASEYNFSLPSMIELMRLKCEAYSTLNDSDEDALAENRIQERLRTQGMEPPKSIIVAPAALYLTAILECICEHILSSVGRVATRDSSKEVAGTNDLFVALCEDDAIYPIFKVSKVFGRIESSLKQSSKPRRSKSLSRSERHELRDVSLPEPQPRSRPSSESAASAALSGSVGSDPRTSLDKGKANKLFRPSNDRDSPLPGAVSRITTSRRSLAIQSDIVNDSATLAVEDVNLTQDFDNLMRSGDTVKVSLTPDRLRTMETAKEQRQPTATNDHSRTSSAADVDSRPPVSMDPKYHVTKKSSHLHVDSIIEDEEPKETMTLPQVASSRSGVAKSPDVRTRSVSSSGITQGIDSRVIGKPLGLKGAPPLSGSLGRGPHNRSKNSPATSRRVRKVQRNRESMDLDDVMNGSEEGSSSSPDPGDQTPSGRARLYPVSKVTRDLISFLEQGPPPEIQPVRSATVSAVSLTPTTKSAKSSRLYRMMSKLSLTKEDRILQASQRDRGVGIVSAPSTPSVLPARSFGANNPSTFPPAVKPMPPPVLSIPPAVPISPPPSSQTSPVDDARPHKTRDDHKRMSVRKAVPAWEGTVDQGVSAPAPPIKDAMITPSPHPAPITSPTPATTPTQSNGRSQSLPAPAPEANGANGYIHDSHKLPRCDSPAATPASLDSAAIEARSRSPTPRENGNGRAEQPHPQGIYRPRSSRPNHRSSVNDEPSNSARRSSGGRRTQQSSGTVDRAPPITITPSLSEAVALDMRRLMTQATTADECRLLVDTFLTRAGITPPFTPVLEPTPSDVEPLERTLVHHFLGADPLESQLPRTGPVPVEAERHSRPTTLECPQESNDLQQSTATSMDPVSAVHAHHIVSAAVAVVS